MTPRSCPYPPLQGGGVRLYDSMSRQAVTVLFERGRLSVSEIAKRMEMDRKTVREILREGASPPEGFPPMGRPPVALRYEGVAREFLNERPNLPTVEVLRLLREKGYAGGKDPVYRMVQLLRPVTTPPVIGFGGLAGEFSQNDFGQARVRYESGAEEILHFFAARLKWSRWMYLEITPNEQVEALSRALLNSFASFGGVPMIAVFDNPKTVVLSRHGPTIDWNPTFAQVSSDYRFAAELCTPGRGQEKGSVENLVKFGKQNFFLVRRFHDREDVVVQLVQWLHEVNHDRPCRATGVSPAVRIEEERRRLRPLPVPPSEYPLRYPVRVGPMATVSFQGANYSMPAEAAGVNATLLLYPKQVRIVVHKRFDEVHDRKTYGGISTLPRHATSVLASVMGRRADLYYKRQRLLEVGPPAEAFLTNLVHARPRVWAGDVNVLFDLWMKYGPERLGEAFQEALDRGWFGSESIERWLGKEVPA